MYPPESITSTNHVPCQELIPIPNSRMWNNTYLFCLAGLCFVCCRGGSYPIQYNQEGYPTKQMSEAKWIPQVYPVALQILNLTVHRAPPTPHPQFSPSFQKNPLPAPSLQEKWFLLFPAAFYENPVYSKSILTQAKYRL